MDAAFEGHRVSIDAGDGVRLSGTLAVPEDAAGVVLFAHGSGSSQFSPRNRAVARALRMARLGTLLMDLLTVDEEESERFTRHLRFDLPLLARRLVGATQWLSGESSAAGLRLGYFGSSTGAGAALIAAALLPDRVGAVVSRGGRPDLAGPALERVQAPTLLIVGGRDVPVIEMNREAMRLLRGEVKLEIVPGATHLFEEPGTLDQVAALARDWFLGRLSTGRRDRPAPPRGAHAVPGTG